MTAATTTPLPAYQPPAAPPRGGRRLLRLGARVVVNLALVVAALALLALGVGPRVADYRTITMLTGSMGPTIEPGDMIVSTPVPVAEVRPGMVLTFQAPTEDAPIVTHRVVSTEPTPDGGVALRTKGDANPVVDPWVAVLRGETAWEVRHVVPGVGSVIRLLRMPALHAALLWGVPTALAGWVLLTVWRPARQDEQR